MKKVLSVLLTLVLIALCALPALAEEPAVFELSGLVIDTSDEGILLDTVEHGEVLVQLTDDTLLETPNRDDLMALEDISDADKAAIDDYLLREQVNGVRVGDYIHVIYNGKMTRSLPAQVTAMEIRCYVLIGHVIAWDDLTAGQTPVASSPADVDVEAVEPEASVQPEADADVPDEESAEDDEDDTEAFLFLDVLTGTQVLVRLPEDAEGAYEVGQELVIYFNGVMTMSLPGQINPDLITVYAPEAAEADDANG